MRLVLAILCLLCLAPPGVRAQDATAPKEAARAKFEAGKKAFRLGNFDLAISEWKSGYNIKADPVFLFNIGQAQREKGDFEAAAFSYEQYLKEAPDAPNQATVQGHLTEIRRILEEQRKARKAPPTGPIDPNKPPPPYVPDEPPPSGRTLKITGLAVGGFGALALITGVVLGVSARSTADEIQASIDAGEPWSQELADKDASGRRRSTLGTAGMIIGGAALVGGGVLFFLGMRRDAARERVSVLPTGTGVVVSWSF